MAGRLVRCPGCTGVLEIPERYTGRKVLCSLCQMKFLIPAASEADILDWIGPRDKDDTAAGTAFEIKPEELPEELMGNEVVESEMDGSSMAGEKVEDRDLTTGVEGLVLHRIDKRGPMFEFPARMLEDKKFRGGLPRRCLRCGAKGNLTPHLVVFARHMTDSVNLENEYVDSTKMLDEYQARNLPQEEVLDQLPRLDKVPEPANLPMPYWICDMCSPKEMIAGEHEVHGGEICCRMQVHRPWRAEEFLVNIGGEGSAAHEAIREELQKNPEVPWDSLAGSTQHRIEQWYKPYRGETFVTYVPDPTRARTEEGMQGIVVTNRRIIYHSSMRHQEAEKGEPIELQFSLEGGKGSLQIKGSKWDLKNIPVDKPGLERLRRGLHKANWEAVWR